MNKHTPGPWILDHGIITTKDWSGIRGIAQLLNPQTRRPLDMSSINWGNDIIINEAESNARLIISAPELLTLLEKCLTHLERQGIENLDTEEARKIIAKAKGEDK